MCYSLYEQMSSLLASGKCSELLCTSCVQPPVALPVHWPGDVRTYLQRECAGQGSCSPAKVG